MSNSQEIPLSGYHLERIYTNRQYFEGVAIDDSISDEEPQVGIGWDWRLRDEGIFEVLLSLTLPACRQRPEKVEVTIVGQFATIGDAQTVNLEQFVCKNAPAILLPYAREAISSLTGRGLLGPFYLPPLNLVEVMKGMDPSVAAGALQLKANPDALQQPRLGGSNAAQVAE